MDIIKTFVVLNCKQKQRTMKTLQVRIETLRTKRVALLDAMAKLNKQGLSFGPLEKELELASSKLTEAIEESNKIQEAVGKFSFDSEEERNDAWMARFGD